MRGDSFLKIYSLSGPFVHKCRIISKYNTACIIMVIKYIFRNTNHIISIFDKIAIHWHCCLFVIPVSNTEKWNLMVSRNLEINQCPTEILNINLESGNNTSTLASWALSNLIILIYFLSGKCYTLILNNFFYLKNIIQTFFYVTDNVFKWAWWVMLQKHIFYFVDSGKLFIYLFFNVFYSI